MLDLSKCRKPKLLTIKGEGLWWELRGEAVHKIITQRPQHKFVSRGGSVGRAITTPDELRGWLMRTLERLIETLNAHAYVCGTLGMQIEFKGCQLPALPPRGSAQTTNPRQVGTVRRSLRGHATPTGIVRRWFPRLRNLRHPRQNVFLIGGVVCRGGLCDLRRNGRCLILCSLW